jgi:hypothetical protein
MSKIILALALALSFLSSIFLVVHADIINQALLQALVDAALWLQDNVPKLPKSDLEAIVSSATWWWQQVLDNADQIGTAWANEAMPAAQDAEPAAVAFATFIKETLGPLLEPLV